MRSCAIHQRALSWEDLKIPMSKTRLKITFLGSHSDLPGANELREMSYVWIQDSDFVNTVSADGLAPKGARPSTGTVLTINLCSFSVIWNWLCWQDGVIQNVKWNLLALWVLKHNLFFLVTFYTISCNTGPYHLEIICISYEWNTSYKCQIQS